MNQLLPQRQIMERVAKVRVAPHMLIREALEPMDRAGFGVVLIMDTDDRLLGVVTDGDIRRAILRHVPLIAPCIEIATADPVVAEPDVTPVDALRLMSGKNGMSHLPIVSENRRVVGLLLRSDLVDEDTLPMAAVVMAGGFGRRLHPHTADTPKPLLPLGDRPIMEYLIEELRLSGIRHVSVSTFHQAEQVQAHFGDGSRFGVEFSYLTEGKPLGTAGALGLMTKHDGPLLVINGDIVTRVSFRAMIAYHREHAADLTVAAHQYDYEVPYGVLECTGNRVRGVREKPVASWLINAGIYLLEARVRKLIPANEPFDMTDLITQLIERDLKVVSFPIVEYWLDIGRHADYTKAQQDVQNGRMGR